MTRVIIRVCAVLCLISLAGCPAHFPEVNALPSGTTADFDRSPRDVMAIVKQMVNSPPTNIGVAEESKGTIVTGWQRFPGTRRGWRVWQEQTRYHIRVVPDWDKPDAKSQVVVREETQERAIEGHEWKTNLEVTRADRAQAMLDQIRQAVNSAPAVK